MQEDPGLYFFVNQGCLQVENMDDKEEMDLVDVSFLKDRPCSRTFFSRKYKNVIHQILSANKFSLPSLNFNNNFLKIIQLISVFSVVINIDNMK